MVHGTVRSNTAGTTGSQPQSVVSIGGPAQHAGQFHRVGADQIGEFRATGYIETEVSTVDKSRPWNCLAGTKCFSLTDLSVSSSGGLD